MGKGSKKIEAAHALAVSKKNDRMSKAEFKKNRARAARNYESAEERRFSQALQDINFRINIVEGDGNCLFRAISDQLFGDTERHMEVRQQVMNYIVANEEHFKLFIEDDESFEDYVSRMRYALLLTIISPVYLVYFSLSQIEC
jgi:OTU domain-containing protein 3